MTLLHAPRRVYLGLGSNLGRRWSYLAKAVFALRSLDRSLECSSIYESAPQGGPDGQGPYLNCVVCLQSDLDAFDLLEFCQGLEADAKRIRDERWGPRTLDVDILFIEDEEIESETLKVPHPEIDNRSFVLAPLEELGANFVPSDWRAILSKEGSERVALRPVGELVRSPISDRRVRNGAA